MQKQQQQKKTVTFYVKIRWYYGSFYILFILYVFFKGHILCDSCALVKKVPYATLWSVQLGTTWPPFGSPPARLRTAQKNRIRISVASSACSVAPGESLTSRCSKHAGIVAAQLLTLSLPLIISASKQSVFHLSSNAFTVSIDESYSERCSVLSNCLDTAAALLHALAIELFNIVFTATRKTLVRWTEFQLWEHCVCVFLPPGVWFWKYP